MKAFRMLLSQLLFQQFPLAAQVVTQHHTTESLEDTEDQQASAGWQGRDVDKEGSGVEWCERSNIQEASALLNTNSTWGDTIPLGLSQYIPSTTPGVFLGKTAHKCN